ncbi:hypothetical protein [Marinicellulosiphila megalodicopiae]|uniref:hypothetical protein n=1 Tax=Marinicellulosiphila megalodicopiae TaxID=2724896 RepID=UPI003BB2046D
MTQIKMILVCVLIGCIRFGGKQYKKGDDPFEMPEADALDLIERGVLCEVDARQTSQSTNEDSETLKAMIEEQAERIKTLEAENEKQADHIKKLETPALKSESKEDQLKRLAETEKEGVSDLNRDDLLVLANDILKLNRPVNTGEEKLVKAIVEAFIEAEQA